LVTISYQKGEFMPDKQLTKLRKYLKTQGKRYSLEREELLEVIQAMDGHFAIEALCKAAREAGAVGADSTIYRNINIFVDAGILDELRLPGGRNVYEKCRKSSRHSHVLCSGCGEVRPVKFTQECSDHLENVCRRNDFTPVSGGLIIRGYCAQCNGELEGE
jgi:Fur family transcriptional regulator, ferric uptake regulator